MSAPWHAAQCRANSGAASARANATSAGSFGTSFGNVLNKRSRHCWCLTSCAYAMPPATASTRSGASHFHDARARRLRRVFVCGSTVGDVTECEGFRRPPRTVAVRTLRYYSDAPRESPLTRSALESPGQRVWRRPRVTRLQSPDVVPRSHRLIRRLLIVYGSALAATVALLCAAFLPASVFPQTYAIARELVGGSGGAASAHCPFARHRDAARHVRAHDRALALLARCRPRSVPHAAHALVARRPGLRRAPGPGNRHHDGTLLIWLAVRLLWPSGRQTASGVAANVAGAFAVGLAFVSLVAERCHARVPEPQLPEAPQLRRILLLATLVLGLAACVEFARAAGIDWFWLYWAELVLICVPGVIAAELTLHALARLFLPPRSAADARAATDSILATLITGGRHAPGTLLKTHFGLDFARSWALKILDRRDPARRARNGPVLLGLERRKAHRPRAARRLRAPRRAGLGARSGPAHASALAAGPVAARRVRDDPRARRRRRPERARGRGRLRSARRRRRRSP